MSCRKNSSIRLFGPSIPAEATELIQRLKDVRNAVNGTTRRAVVSDVVVEFVESPSKTDLPSKKTG